MIMNANLSFQKIKNLLLGFAASIILFSCGSFKSASYFDSDGIYATQSSREQQVPQVENKNNYYSQYFKDVADNNVPVNYDDTYFTDTESYGTTDQYQTNSVDSGYTQIPWGGETSQTEIIVVNNTPNYLWGLSGFAFNYSPFWNNYYGNRFGYGRFYNPYNSPYGWGYAGYWGGFNSFYSPFNYGGFYHPYYNGYSNPWNRYNRWNRNGYANRFGNRYNNYNNKNYNSTVARVKSGRGEKNYGSSDRNSKAKGSRQSKSNEDVKNTLNRVNVGRRYNSIGRNVVLGNNRLGVKNSGGSITARPTVNAGNYGTSGVSRSGNSNPNKSVKSSSSRFSQSRYSPTVRNRSNRTNPRARTTATRNKTVSRPNTKRQYNNNYNQTRRNTTQNKSNSYSTPSSSRSYSSPSRSYSSGSRGGSSGRSSAGRGSSSGRRN